MRRKGKRIHQPPMETGGKTPGKQEYETLTLKVPLPLVKFSIQWHQGRKPLDPRKRTWEVEKRVKTHKIVIIHQETNTKIHKEESEPPRVKAFAWIF